jgi:hypothetical protein
VLDLIEVAVRNLQLMVLVRRRKCTTVEKGILMLRLLKLTRNGSVVLIVCGQTHTLLHDGSSGLVLQVEQVLHVLGHCSHVDIEVQALDVGHGLKALLPHRIFLNLNREQRDQHRGGSGEATLTQSGEWDVCHLLDGGVRLTADDIHGSIGLRGIITLASYTSRPSNIDMQQW